MSATGTTPTATATATATTTAAESVDDKIVQEIVDDVRHRAKRNGFSVADRANALYLAGQSAHVLGLEASAADLEAAADELW